MTTLIQAASNVSGVTTVTPLYVLREVSQTGTVTSPAVVTSSSITTLGATATSDTLTYDPLSLLQSFSPTFSVSGLTPTQQKQLALALGLNANATSTDLTNAINALLTPANPGDSLINVLVGGATTEATAMPAATAINTAVVVNPAVNLPAESTAQTAGSLPTTGVTGTGVTVVTTLPPTTTVPETTASSVNAAPITFDNADSMLQSLLADAASHALITASQASATYSVPGTVYQLSSGVDRTRQANLKGKLSDIRNTLNPVAHIAAVRETLERKS